MFVTGQFCRQGVGTLTEGMDKLQLTGRNLGQVFNFRSGNNNELKKLYSADPRSHGQDWKY